MSGGAFFGLQKKFSIHVGITPKAAHACFVAVGAGLLSQEGRQLMPQINANAACNGPAVQGRCKPDL